MRDSERSVIDIVLSFEFASDEYMYSEESSDGISVPLNFRQVCEIAFQYRCYNVILAHNHPGGIARPSVQDVRLTERLFTILHSLDIRLLDHFIVTETECVSLTELGYIGMGKPRK